MKRSNQMAVRGIPTARGPQPNGKPKLSRNRCFPPSLGDTVITTRSTRCIGGERPGCRWIKKLDNRARRAGYLSHADLMATATKLGFRP